MHFIIHAPQAAEAAFAVDFCASLYVFVVGYFASLQIEFVTLKRRAQFFQQLKKAIKVESVLLSLGCIPFFSLKSSESEQVVDWLSGITMQVFSIDTKLKQAAWLEDVGILLSCR